MEQDLKLEQVSIIIPTKNEEKFIAACLDSVIANDYPKDKLEILVVDGLSKDKTFRVAEEYSKRHPYIKILKNINGYAAFALNIGIKTARGEIILRMDAHSIYEKEYISKCVRYLNEYRADNVGGIWKIVPRKNTIIAKAIAISLSHIFGTGNADYKIQRSKVPKQVDTVPFGCYRKSVFLKIGLFNERLLRSQDMEFNLRLKKSGGKILLIPDIVSFYYVRSNLKDYFLHNIIDGIWAIYPLKFVSIPLRVRHYVPLVFTLFLISLLVLSLQSLVYLQFLFSVILLYLTVSIYFSVKISNEKNDYRYLFLMPLVFGIRHFGYGLGSIIGLVKLFLPAK